MGEKDYGVVGGVELVLDVEGGEMIEERVVMGVMERRYMGGVGMIEERR